MERIFSNKAFTPVFLFILAATVVLTYSNTFTGRFQFDDLPSIVENPSVQSLGSIWSVLIERRGVTLATFAVNYAVGGVNTAGYHAVNTAIHVINSMLAYFVLFFAFTFSGSEEAKARRLSALTVLFFALHPIQTQSVAYIVQRMESLASLFYLLSIIFLVAGARAQGSGKRLLFYALVAVAYALGFQSKEIAITMPAAIFLFDLFFISGLEFKKTFSRFPLYAVLAAMLVIFAFMTVKGLGGFNDVSEESQIDAAVEPRHPAIEASIPAEGKKTGLTAGFTIKDMSKKDYLYTQFNVLVYYMALMLAPVSQNLDYDFPVSRGLFETPTVAEGTAHVMPLPPPAVSLFILSAIVLAAFILFLRSRKNGSFRMKVIAFSIFWYFILLSPTSSFIPIADVIYEHRVYLASLGFFAVFVVLVDALVEKLFPAKAA